MRYRFFRPLAVLLTLVLACASLIPAIGAPVLAQGSDAGSVYTDATYDFEIGWSDPWSQQSGDDDSWLELGSGDATLLIRGEADDLTPQDRLQQEIDSVLYADGTTAEIGSDDGNSATAEWRSGSLSRLVRVIALPDAGVNVIVTLVAADDVYDASIEAAGAVTLNGDSLLGADGSDRATDGNDTGSVSGNDDTGNDGGAPNLKLPTPEPLGNGVDGDTYTSPNFGYSFNWDASIWDVAPDGEVSEAGYDLLSLYGQNGNLLIYAFEDYGGDPATCLSGEADYFSFETGITDWQVAEDADGNPLAGETDDSAYAVYTLTYTDPESERTPGRDMVDYIECRALGGDAVLVIAAISIKSLYNSHIDDVIDVTDTITLYDAGSAETPEIAESPEDAETPEATGTPDIAGEDEGETPGTGNRPGRDSEFPGRSVPEGTPASDGAVPDQGEQYTSEQFGYSLAIPATWTVEDRQSTATDDTLVLNNGISTVTVWGSSSFTGETLGECVDFAASSSDEDLTLQVQASGLPFQGGDDLSAYAAFSYDKDGTPQTWFVKCQWLEEGSSVLIIIQDVPTESYAQQRQARRQIENLIQMP